MELQARPVVALTMALHSCVERYCSSVLSTRNTFSTLELKQRGRHEPVGVAEQHEENEPAAHQRDEQQVEQKPRQHFGVERLQHGSPRLPDEGNSRRLAASGYTAAIRCPRAGCAAARKMYVDGAVVFVEVPFGGDAQGDPRGEKTLPGSGNEREEDLEFRNGQVERFAVKEGFHWCGCSR